MKSTRKVGSPRGEVGEIDTRAPFQSVKAAVSLFGEVAVSKDRYAVKRRSSENVFEKETQLILAQKELDKLKKQVESAETSKVKVLSDLENAKVVLQSLTTKLNNVRESKQSAMEAAKAVKNQSKKLAKGLSLKAVGFEAWKRELEKARKEYTTTTTELDASKQELTKIKQDFDAALEAKLAAFQSAGEAQRSAKLNSERISELSDEIATMKASIEQLKLASVQSQEEQEQVMGQNETPLGFYKTAKEEAQKRLESLKNEYDPELIKSLEAKLAETSVEIDVLQEQMKKVHASKMDSMRLLTSELKEATKTLQDVAEEETSLKKLVFSLRTELKQVKKEQDELKEKEEAAEELATDLSDELEEIMGEATPELGTVEDLEANILYVQCVKIHKLQSETEDAKREAEEMSRKAQELKQEAEKSRAVAEEGERKLELVLIEAKEAKAAEQRALKEMKILSEVQGKVSNSKFIGRIRMSNEELESLSGKVKECEDLVEQKEAAVTAQLQEIYTRKNEEDRKVEANMKAIEEIKAATETALWNEEMADSAKVAIEDELRRWYQQEQKVVANASPQILDYSNYSSRPISLSI
ncbi:WEB family protein At1g12150-like [Gastrolobium bilobum]|uniref:WEB family protein At1g12150-like n=1 Tax=Gastrolobium bilobum TaxID=150636 RepID=UPI002AB1C1F2|nr:WEB family protein At1g12150-like [Gastrolobium bilobum]